MAESNQNREAFILRLHAFLQSELGPKGEKWGDLFPDEDMDLQMATWVRSGTIFSHSKGGSNLKVIVPMVKGLSFSPDLQNWIDKRNRLQYCGHYWLSEWDDDVYGMFCAIKWPWDWMDNEQIAEKFYYQASLGESLEEVAQEVIAQFGGERMWKKDGSAHDLEGQTLAYLF